MTEIAFKFKFSIIHSRHCILLRILLFEIIINTGIVYSERVDAKGAY